MLHSLKSERLLDTVANGTVGVLLMRCDISTNKITAGCRAASIGIGSFIYYHMLSECYEFMPATISNETDLTSAAKFLPK